MSLNSNDSGVFRVPAADAGANSEIRLPQKPPATAARQHSEPPRPAQTVSVSVPLAADAAARINLGNSANPPPTSAKITLPASEENTAPRVHSTDAPREVRVPISPPAPATPSPSPKVSPAIEKEHRVSLPSGARAGLGYSADFASVSVSARKLEFPPTCPCCNRPADMNFEAVVEKKRDRQESKAWTFPYCGTCLRHLRQAHWQRYAARGASVLIAAIICGVGFLAGFLVPAGIAGAILGAAGWFWGERLLYSRLADAAQPECVCYGPAVRFAEYYATEQHFEFANEAYARTFSAVNEKKLL